MATFVALLHRAGAASGAPTAERQIRRLLIVRSAGSLLAIFHRATRWKNAGWQPALRDALLISKM